MSTPGLGAARQHAVLGDAEHYLSDTAPGQGGRNTRPLALPALTATYCTSARTGQGMAAALLGALGGGIAWFALAQLTQPQPSIVLVVVALVLAGAAVAAAAVLGLRVLRQGRSLVAALRRWHGIAPEVPVAGVDVLSSAAAVTRLVLAGAGMLIGIAAVVAAAAAGTLASWVGGSVVAAWLLGSGLVALLGWWRVRVLLSSATPQTDHTSFAPAVPAPSGPQQWAPDQQPAAAAGPAQWAPRPPVGATPSGSLDAAAAQRRSLHHDVAGRTRAERRPTDGGNRSRRHPARRRHHLVRAARPPRRRARRRQPTAGRPHARRPRPASSRRRGRRHVHDRGAPVGLEDPRHVPGAGGSHPRDRPRLDERDHRRRPRRRTPAPTALGGGAAGNR